MYRGFCMEKLHVFKVGLDVCQWSLSSYLYIFLGLMPKKQYPQTGTTFYRMLNLLDSERERSMEFIDNNGDDV